MKRLSEITSGSANNQKLSLEKSILKVPYNNLDRSSNANLLREPLKEKT